LSDQPFDTVLALNDRGQRDCRAVIGPVLDLPGVRSEVAGEVPGANGSAPLWRCQFQGPNSSDPIRIGVFAAIHGDEPAGALAACEFLKLVSKEPSLAQNFLLFVYPICNPAGFEANTRHSCCGKDLNREFWRNSCEPEVRILEQELKARHFQGIVQLHADDTSDGVYGFVRGHTLTENLLRPALRAAGAILPRNVNATIDGFAARDGIIFDQYDGILAAPPEVDPVPFEIVLETPHHAPIEKQVQALQTALITILSEYRQMMAFAANL
jgi:hypothetical protein